MRKRKKDRKKHDKNRAKKRERREKRRGVRAASQAVIATTSHQSDAATVRVPAGPTLMGLRPGSRELLAIEPTWEAVSEHIARYSLGQVFNIVGRISAVVSQVELGDVSVQRRLCSALLEEKADTVWLGVQRLARETYQEQGVVPAIVLFDDLSLTTAIKVACMVLPTAEQPKEKSLRPLGEALLMINDLVEETSLSPRTADASTREGIRKWVYYLFVAGLFSSRPNPLNTLARTFDLFLTDHNELKLTSGAYVNLPSLAAAATGLQPLTLWAVLFALQSYFQTIDADNAATSTAAISRTQYFHRFDFTPEEVDRFFGIVAADLAVISNEMRELYSLDRIRPYHVLPLARTPICVEGDLAFCPQLRLLFEKMSDGLYHVLLNALADSRARDRFQIFVGDVFQNYVDRLFHRVFDGGQNRARYISEAELSAAIEQSRKGKRDAEKACDGLVVLGDSVVLLETKAKLFPAEVRSGDNQELFFERLEELFQRSARQISSTVDLLQSGRLASLGIDSALVRRCYPLILLLQKFPMRPPIFRYLATEMRRENLLLQRGVRPFQVLDVGELELLEIALHEGADLDQVLEAKIQDSWGVQESFNNYVFARKQPVIRARHNAYLEQLYLHLGEETRRYFHSRSKGGAQDSTPSD